MEKRPLGNTEVKLSVVGFGGIIVKDETPKAARAIVKEAVERGVNYFDVAPTYGNAIDILGPALEPYRNDVFLACKTIKRSREGAAECLRESLERLRTDHFDLFQIHGLESAEEAAEVAGEGGALEALLKAREEGSVKLIGFSAHSEDAALAMMERFDFDTVMFPLNYICWYEGGFGRRILAEARTRGMGILALKALARRDWKDGEKREWPKCWYRPSLDREEAAMALRWTLSHPITAAVSPSHAELLWWMCDVADNFDVMTDGEFHDVAETTRGIEPIFKTQA